MPTTPGILRIVPSSSRTGRASSDASIESSSARDQSRSDLSMASRLPLNPARSPFRGDLRHSVASES